MRHYEELQPVIIGILCVNFQKSPDVLIQELSSLFRETQFNVQNIIEFLEQNLDVKFPLNQLPINFVPNIQKQPKPPTETSIYIPDIIIGQGIALESSTTQLPDLILSVQKPLLASASQTCQLKPPIPCKCQNCAVSALDQMMELINKLKHVENFMSVLNYSIETQLKYDGCRCAFKVLTANFQYHNDFTLLKDLDKSRNWDLIRQNVSEVLFPYIDVSVLIDYDKKRYTLIHASHNQLVHARYELTLEQKEVLGKIRSKFGVDDVFTAPIPIKREIEQELNIILKNHRILNPYYPFSLINECFKCSCTSSCMLRNVQLKQMPKMFIKYSNQSQYGVYCNELIPQGAFVSEYPGLVHTDTQAENIGYFQDSIRCSYLFDINLDHLKHSDDDGLSIDASRVGNVSRFFNHSAKPNLEKKFVFWDDDGYNAYGQIGICHLCLFASEDIWPGTELCFDYEYSECPELKKLYPWAF